MSLNPSNMIVAATNPTKTMFPNLARHVDWNDEDLSAIELGKRAVVFGEVDTQCEKELTEACIPMERGGEIYRRNKEVPVSFCGNLVLWGFRRAWYYWVAEGPGISADKATEFHKTYGTQCRVNGHCGCPSPLEQNHGFGIGLYHIDTQEGLNAFAQLLRSIYIEKEKINASS